MKACVIFDTLFGNTEKIAISLRAGLRSAGVVAECVNMKEVALDSLVRYDLLCVGGPTQYRTISKTMQDFLEMVEKLGLSGKKGFAFDTRRDAFMAGSAAVGIEKGLQKSGLKVIRTRASAIIVGPDFDRKKSEFNDKDEWKEWRHKNERLLEGEERRFEQIGREIGTILNKAEISD